MTEEKKKLSTGKLVGLGCLGLIMLIIVIAAVSGGGGGGKKETTQQPAQPQKTETKKEEPKPKQWVTVFEANGKTDKRTDSYELQGGKAKLAYNVTGNKYVVLSIYVVEEGRSLETEGGFPEVTINEPGSDTTFLTKKAGKYYLDVKAANTTGWTIKIEEER